MGFYPEMMSKGKKAAHTIGLGIVWAYLGYL